MRPLESDYWIENVSMRKLSQIDGDLAVFSQLSASIPAIFHFLPAARKFISWVSLPVCFRTLVSHFSRQGLLTRYISLIKTPNLWTGGRLWGPRVWSIARNWPGVRSVKGETGRSSDRRRFPISPFFHS